MGGKWKLTDGFESIGRSPLSLRRAQVRGAYEKLVESFGPGGRGLDWAIPAIRKSAAEHRSAVTAVLVGGNTIDTMQVPPGRGHGRAASGDERRRSALTALHVCSGMTNRENSRPDAPYDQGSTRRR